MSVETSDVAVGRRSSLSATVLTPRVRRVLFIILLLGCTAIFMAPFLWLVSASLKVRADVFNSDIIILADHSQFI